MLELNTKFQRELFTELLKKYGRKFLSKKLRKSSPTLYGYKNNRSKAIPKIVIEKAIKLSNFSEKELSKNIIKTFSAKESIREIMRLGAKINHEQLKQKLSIKFGSFDLLQEKGDLLSLDILNWLNKNQWLEKLKTLRGFFKNPKIEKISRNNIRLSYFTYSKSTKRIEKYFVSLPKKLKFNLDFCYFLGLLYGDGLSGARIGIVNKDKNLIEWTAKFLKKYFNNNKIKSRIFIYNNSIIKTKDLLGWLNSFSNEAEIYYNPKARGKYVFNIFITNSILRRLIEDFFNNLESLFLKFNFEQKGAFLAGFFDAEGNVNKLDGNFRFSQKIENKVAIIRKLLEKEGYHTRYDGSNILIGYKQEYKNDLKLFEKQILPFLRHSQKQKEAQELAQGFLVRAEYKPILEIISLNNNITQKEISKMINRAKCYGKLLALFKAGFVNRTRNKVDESFKYLITNKGLEYLGGKSKS